MLSYSDNEHALSSKKHFDKMESIYQNQNSVAAYSAILNPFIAVRNLSMGMAGSDYKTALAFQKYAEKYRYEMVEKLNNHMRDFSKTGDWEKKADASIYAKIPDFDFKNPSIMSVLSQNWVALLAHLIWIFLSVRMVSNLKNINLS
jgi:ABC-2 type transport system permease protein